MQKVILYYKFTPLSDPAAVRLWQRQLCESLGLKGRILISNHGINGTLGGDIEALKSYVKQTKQYDGFRGMIFKWSDGTGNDFPRLSVRTRKELVAFGAPYDVEVNEQGVVGGGIHLKPEQVNKLVEERGDDVVFFDGRNAYEAKIGRFKGAVVPDVDTSKDFLSEIADPKYNDIKDKPVVTYCTGGIRCEILSALMKKQGFNEVYQVDGGIVKYGEKYKDQGHWEGALYVFDDRMVQKFSDQAKDIADCTVCGGKTSNFVNCDDVDCNNLLVVCAECAEGGYLCTAECRVRLGKHKPELVTVG